MLLFHFVSYGLEVNMHGRNMDQVFFLEYFILMVNCTFLYLKSQRNPSTNRSLLQYCDRKKKYVGQGLGPMQWLLTGF